MTVRISGAWCKAGFLAWVARSMGLVESLHRELPGYPLPKSMLAQALSVFAISSPCLRELLIECPDMFHDEAFFEDRPWCWYKHQGWDWDNWASCLPMFHGLTRLSIYSVRFIPDIPAILEVEEHEEEDEPASLLIPQDFFDGMKLQVCLPHY